MFIPSNLSTIQLMPIDEIVRNTQNVIFENSNPIKRSNTTVHNDRVMVAANFPIFSYIDCYSSFTPNGVPSANVNPLNVLLNSQFERIVTPIPTAEP